MDELARRISELVRQGSAASSPQNRPSVSEPTLPGEPESNARGSFLAYRRPLSGLFRDFEQFYTQSRDAARRRQHPTDLVPLATGFAEQLIYLDLETCGLSGSAIFLVGVIHPHQGNLTLSQFFARTYAEEGAILQALADCLSPETVLVTYNGKSFDWPMVADRLARHRLSGPSPTEHVDLLHVARRRWKGKLPDCKLQTLETHICKRRREGDLGGKDVANAYHEFVRSGKISDVLRILKHNALDLLTLFQLTPVLLTGSPAAE